MLRLALFIFWLLIVPPSLSHLHAGTRDPNTPDSKYLEFGKKFHCVRQIRATITYEGADLYQFGSAVIIKPNWVLTAAHVVYNTREPVILMGSQETVPLTKVIIHDEFEDVKIGFHDIALCYSPQDFSLPFYTPLYEDSDELNKPVTIAGYGFTGTFHTGATVGDNQKRAGHNRVSGVERAVLICTPNKTNKFPLDFCIASGDSGGGLFIGNKLAGINSFLAASDKKPDGTYTDEGAHTRVSLYAQWVYDQIAAYELLLQARATTGANPAIEFKIAEPGAQP